MDLGLLAETLRHGGVWVVFTNVLLQQLGLPLPAIPTLLMAGSVAQTPSNVAGLLASSVLASVIADVIWYSVGRAFGYRVLNGLCRLSINPASCVTQTEGRFNRWGAWSLIVAKFVPGFSTVAPPIAGALKMPLPAFAAASAAGAALWAGVALLAGWWLRDQVQAAIEWMDRQGPHLLLVAGVVLALWLGWKFWQRYRFEKLAAIPHITPERLIEEMATSRPPRVLDFRGPGQAAQFGVIPGSTLVTLNELAQLMQGWSKDETIVTLCACPEDATAVEAASRLLRAGHRDVRPLRGGFDGWLEATAALPPGRQPARETEPG